jgi:hypothetical protein
VARQGKAWLSKARQGVASKARRGEVKESGARQGKAWLGKERRS